MKNKGFTLVELLTVIVLISLVTVIAIPLIQKVDVRIKENMLESKKSSAQNALIMWAQENEKCFMDSTGIDCIIDINNDCVREGDNLNCHTTYGNMAHNYLIAYDKDNKVINPVDNTDMTNDLLYITYNTFKRTFSANPSYDTHTTKTPIEYTVPDRPATTKPLYDETVKPMIRLLKSSDTEWKKSHGNTVIVQDIDSGLAPGGSFKYGWSISNVTEPTKYYTYSLTYPTGTTEEVTADISADGLTGKMYIWIKPNIEDRKGNKADTLISAGTFYFDNTPPEELAMNFSLEDWSTYGNEWTNKDIYVARSETIKAPNGGNDLHSGLKEYQISVDDKTWKPYAFDSNSNLYTLSTDGTYDRYFRACDNLDNCNSSIKVTGKVDKTAPTIELIGTTSTKITVKFNDNIDGSGISSYCLINSSNASSCTWTPYTGANIYSTPSVPITNSYPRETAYLFAKDGAGNISEGYEFKPLVVTVIFHRNTSSSDTVTETRVYQPGVSGQHFETFGWTKKDRTLRGWNLAKNKDKNEANYTPTNGINDAWLNTYLGQEVHLYAKWISIIDRTRTCYSISTTYYNLVCDEKYRACNNSLNLCWCTDEAHGGWIGLTIPPIAKPGYSGNYYWAYKTISASKSCPPDAGNAPKFQDWGVLNDCASGYSVYSENSNKCIKWD